MECEKRCKNHGNAEPKMRVTPKEYHHGRWECSKCNKFLQWAKKPTTIAGQKYRQGLIVEKLMSSAESLSRDEVEALCMLFGKPHMSLSAQSKWYKLFDVPFEQAVCQLD